MAAVAGETSRLCCSNNDDNDDDDSDRLPLPWEDEEHVEEELTITNAETVLSVVGNGPLVLSVPHGGNLRPSHIPNRTTGCMEPDTHTAQLAWAMYAHCCRFYKDNKRRPSLVMGKLHRCKVDLARPRHVAANSDGGRQAWEDYPSWTTP